MSSTLKEVKEFLATPKTIAVIGASKKQHRAGHFVPKFLQSKGWDIIPINPYEDSILGEECLDDQNDITEKIDGLLVYRNSQDAEKEALRAIENELTPLIWFPDNVTSSKVAKEAAEQSITFVQDRCPLRDYRLLLE